MPRNPTAASERKPGGNHEGITVHGHWIIEVRNPDGKLAPRREFENAYPAGGAYLPSLLSGNNSPGGLSVLLNGQGTSFSTAQLSAAVNALSFPSSAVSPCSPLSFVIGNVTTDIRRPVRGTTCSATGPGWVRTAR